MCAVVILRGQSEYENTRVEDTLHYAAYAKEVVFFKLVMFSERAPSDQDGLTQRCKYTEILAVVEFEKHKFLVFFPDVVGFVATNAITNSIKPCCAANASGRLFIVL